MVVMPHVTTVPTTTADLTIRLATRDDYRRMMEASM